MTNANRIIFEADRNHAMRSFVDLVIPEGNHGADLPYDPSTILQESDVDQGGYFKVVRDGEAMWYKATDPTLKAAIDELHSSGANDITSKILAAPANSLRWGVTHATYYPVRNFARDFFNRMMVGDPDLAKRYGAVFDPNLKAEDLGLPDIPYSKWREMWITSGGGMGNSRLSGDTAKQVVTESLRKAVKDGDILTSFSRVIGSYGRIIEATEDYNRVAEFRNVYKKMKHFGATDRDARIAAARASRELLDFAAVGVRVKTFKKYVAFMNAAIQGTAVTGRAFKNRPVAMVLKTMIAPMVTIAFGELAWNWACGDDAEEAYRNLPSWRRAAFLNLYKGDGRFVTIPLPQQVTLLKDFVTRAYGKVTGDEHAFDGFIKTAAGEMLGMVDPMQMNPAKALIEIESNHRFFPGGPIVPYYEEQQRLQDRKGAKKASRAGKLFSWAVGSDPRYFDQFVRSSLGGVGNLGLMASDVGREDKPRNAMDYVQTLSGLAAQVPGYDARDVQLAEEMAKEAGKVSSPALKTMRNLLRKAQESANDDEREKYRLAAMREAKRFIAVLERRKSRSD